MLSIQHLSVALASGDTIIKDFSLDVAPGTVHALMGKNGSGKSTLALTLMGHPAYVVSQGNIYYNGCDITALSPDKRATMGIFLAFQHPYEIPGVTVATFLKEAYQACTKTQIGVREFQELLLGVMEQLEIDPLFAHRELNVGFSGGEKKRLELLQLVLLKPTLALLDEIDSGLDMSARSIVVRAINILKEQSPTSSIIMITHYQPMLDLLCPDYVHIMREGRCIASGSAELAKTLADKGYDAFNS